MNKASEKPTVQYEFPKGAHFSWSGDGPFGAANLKAMISPTVQVVKAEQPVTFLGSFDGSAYEVIRDKEGEVVRITKPGVYRLPVAVVWLRPVCEGSVLINTFVQSRG